MLCYGIDAELVTVTDRQRTGDTCYSDSACLMELAFGIVIVAHPVAVYRSFRNAYALM